MSKINTDLNRNNKFALFWISFASLCLLLSGALAPIITSAKMPYIKEMVKDLDFIRWCLAIHVNLATLVWFTAFPIGLTYWIAAKNTEQNLVSKFHILGAFLSILGVLVFVSAFPAINVKVFMSNYVPVVVHPRFFIGISIYVIGVVISYLNPAMIKTILTVKKQNPFYSSLGFGLLLGIVYFFLCVFTFLFSLKELLALKAPFNEIFFEKLMWGAGHSLQHSSSVFSILTWLLLYYLISGKVLFSRKQLFPVFLFLSLAVFVIPVLNSFSVLSVEYIEGFTFLMKWGIAPAFVYLIVKAFFISPKIKKSFEFYALMACISLMLIGFLFGIFIRGSDLRIPGHYHAAIGSVTLSFMILAYILLSGKKVLSKCMRGSVLAFFIGQVLFSSSMFVAGVLGIERKTYGNEHSVEGLWQNIVFLGMAVGGLIALTGGVLFAISVIKKLDFSLFLIKKNNSNV